jgi:hypothetical protein
LEFYEESLRNLAGDENFVYYRNQLTYFINDQEKKAIDLLAAVSNA